MNIIGINIAAKNWYPNEAQYEGKTYKWVGSDIYKSAERIVNGAQLHPFSVYRHKKGAEPGHLVFGVVEKVGNEYIVKSLGNTYPYDAYPSFGKRPQGPSEVRDFRERDFSDEDLKSMMWVWPVIGVAILVIGIGVLIYR